MARIEAVIGKGEGEEGSGMRALWYKLRQSLARERERRAMA